MRHLKAGRKLGRNSSHRKAMYRNMVTSLMVHGRIRTTEAKAKELRRYAERVITLGKRITPSDLEGLSGAELEKAKAARLHNIRRARNWVHDPDALNRVFGEYAERYKERPGGYTRIYKAGFRGGDNAPMAIIELVETPPPATEEGPAADEVAADPVGGAVADGGEE
ncbi:MAG: 50S ribosomal protein L17 [Deltaproteobacteria bacterium]|nr:MAG: 50S ribosomal protein L17 [Deltaproteobacteria bacterium]